MSATARKYNPGFLSDDELVASFCVRTEEFESIAEALRECPDDASPHQIVIGPRGSGKTSLLLRVAVEIRRDPGLSARFFPIVFSEESYDVLDAGEFWLECLSRLTDQAPADKDGPDLRRTFEELRGIRDDRVLGDRCLGTLQDYSDRIGKRLVLVVENLNMMFGDIKDPEAGWRLRHTLQTEPRILVLASTTSRFEEIDNPKHALYDLFREHTLRKLDANECAVLWQSVSGRPRQPATIQALRILTGGSPRLLAIVAQFGARLSFRELMADLLDLVDDHTEYFKSHLDALPGQERRVYLALADLWIPATAREIADRARLDTSQCSAHLKRLVDRGVVEVAGGSERRRHYYLAERLYNIYYLMRRTRGPVPMIEALVRFMEGYYSVAELRDIGVRIAREATGLDGEALTAHRTALARLVNLRSLAAHREELLALAPWIAGDRPGEGTDVPDAGAAARALLDRAFELAGAGRAPEALDAWDEVLRQFGASDAPADLETVGTALINRGTALGVMGRLDEALDAWDETLSRYDSSPPRVPANAAARALIKKAAMFGDLERPDEGLAACDELLARFGAADKPELLVEVAAGMVCRGRLLSDLDRPEAALAALTEVVQRFGSSTDPAMQREVAAACLDQGLVFARDDRLEEALAAWMRVAERFGGFDAPEFVRAVAEALTNAGTAFLQMDRSQEALGVLDDAIWRCRTTNSADLLAILGRALNQKGAALVFLLRPAEALAVWDELVRDPRIAAVPELLPEVVSALGHMATLLSALKRPEQALAAWDEGIRRCEASEAPELASGIAEALVNKGGLLIKLDRQGEGLAAWDEVVRRFGSSEVPAVRDKAALALLQKGTVLARMGRRDEGLTVWDDLIQRFGSAETELGQAALAGALANKGGALAELNRPDEALVTLEEVVRRFGAAEAPMLQDAVSTALLGTGAAFVKLNRLAEAVAAYDEVLLRNRERTAPEALEAIASAFLGKGSVLAALGQPEGAWAAWEEVVQRFEESRLPALRDAAEFALLSQADAASTSGQPAAATALVERAFAGASAGADKTRWRGHAIRARARLAEGDPEACAQDVEALLTMLAGLHPTPREALDALSWLAVEMDARQLRDLIEASPAADLLLPMQTALEKELGLEPRVAKEVEEIADDILRDWEARRKGKQR